MFSDFDKSIVLNRLTDIMKMAYNLDPDETCHQDYGYLCFRLKGLTNTGKKQNT